VDFDRACGVRRRGARWRLRAGVFASPGSTFAGLFACLRGCLLAIVFVLWIRIALRDAYTTTSPALGARRVATQKGLSTWTAMLAVPGKSSGKWGDNDSLLRSRLLKTPQLVIGRFRCVNPVKARGSGAVPLALEQLSSEVADDAPPIAYCRPSLKARRLGNRGRRPLHLARGDLPGRQDPPPALNDSVRYLGQFGE